MIPAAFEYVRAGSVDEALDLLARDAPEAKLLAGGHSLLPLMKLRLARPERLIDIGRVADLRGVRDGVGEALSIGPLTTYAELLEDARIGRYAVLADALPRIGDVQVRNRGTIGGSIAHADPAADMAAVLLALDAVVVARSAARGEREIAMPDFVVGAFETALEPDELITEVTLPGASGKLGSAYVALAQPASGYPIAGVAAVVGWTAGAVDEGSGWNFIRIGVTGVGEHPYRATAAEAALHGTAGDDDAVAAAADRITDGQAVNGDIHADPAYRTAMARVMAKRAIELASARLPG